MREIFEIAREYPFCFLILVVYVLFGISQLIDWKACWKEFMDMK